MLQTVLENEIQHSVHIEEHRMMIRHMWPPQIVPHCTMEIKSNLEAADDRL